MNWISKIEVRQATNGYIVRYVSTKPHVGWVETIFEDASEAIQFAIDQLK